MTRDRRTLPVRVRDDIRTLIDSSGLGPGDQVPTEAELAARFDVARTTVREAFKLLEQDGLIEVRHGRGRFVSILPRLERPITRLESVTEMMAGLGFTLTALVLGVRSDAATPAEVDCLELSQGAEVIRLERAWLQGDDPLIYSVDALPLDAVRRPAAQVDWSESLFDLLDASDNAIASAVARIRAVGLPAGMAARLRLPRGRPWLLVDQRNLTATGRPILCSHDYYRGDRVTFNVLRRRFG